jgi:acetyl esterase/lipase
MSAYLDLSLKGPSYSANLGVDPTFTDSLEPSIPYYLDDLSKVCDPEVSPIYGDYSGFPPTFYAVDDTEIFLSDALIGCDRLYKLGIPCHALVTHGLVHVYEFEEVNIKESRHFYAELKKFLQQNKIL